MNRHLVLFLLTVVTTTIAGAGNYLGFLQGFSNTTVELTRSNVAQILIGGLWFSVPFLGFLTAHEFGHYYAARWHGLRPSLPYFIPFPPIIPTGSLGAVIVFRGRFPDRRVLFDFAAGGPLAGFVVALGALALGLFWSPVQRLPDVFHGEWLGEPLLFQWLSRAIVGPVPDGWSINLHPTAFAGWFGVLFTMMNLMPIGQLDGGHITYALARRHGRWVTFAGLGLLAVLIVGFHAYSWILWLILLLVMLRFIGWDHPSADDDELPLGPARLALAALVIVIFVLCFTPVPISPIELVNGK
jgi:membrane-associated protease RseP (regulator of RpoE activity)